jgi:hypothetical protein
MHICWNIIYIYILVQSLSQKAASGCPNCEKNMQGVAELTLSDKVMGKETVRQCLHTMSHTVCLVSLWLQLQMTQCSMYQFPLCFCSGKTFRNLFHVLIYSTELRWWNIHSGFFYMILKWKINHINQVFKLQLHQQFLNLSRKCVQLGLCCPRNTLDRILC